MTSEFENYVPIQGLALIAAGVNQLETMSETPRIEVQDIPAATETISESSEIIDPTTITDNISESSQVTIT